MSAEAEIDRLVAAAYGTPRRRVPRGPLPHHEALRESAGIPAGAIVCERQVGAFVTRIDPPPAPRWSGDMAPLHAAYFDQVKP